MSHLSGDPAVYCQQILAGDSSVYSVQWIDLPPSSPSLTSTELYRLYLDHISRWTAGIIKPCENTDGTSFQLAGTGCSLITFNPPFIDDRNGLVLTINGGTLVQRDQCDRGRIVFNSIKTAEFTRLELELSDYCPLILGSDSPSWLRKQLYRFTQAFIHKLVTVRFLARVHFELTGIYVNRTVYSERMSGGERI